VLSSDGASGDGASVGWQGSWWNVVYPGETATATVNVTVDSGFSGDLAVVFNLSGDGYGNPPHSLSGTIVLAGGTPVPLELLSPNGNEAWGIGQSHEIEWVPTGGPLQVDILCSTNGGGSWDTVVAQTDDDGSFTWPVDAEMSDNCLVRVCLSQNRSIGDTSDSSFSIYEPVQWLSVSPVSGDIPVGSSSTVELTFDTAELDEGEYHANLVITSNAGAPVVVPVTLYVAGTGVDDRVPESAVLYGNFPNPFGQSTRVAFSLPGSAAVKMSIYTVDGRLVRSLSGDSFDSGRHTIAWDGQDDYGARLPGGVYFYRLEAGGRDLRGKMVMIR
jgi:hypothetical protein